MDRDNGPSQDWDRNALEWVKQLRAGNDRVREEYNIPAFMDFVGPVAGLAVADLACGEGDVSRRLASAGAEVWACDTSTTMLEYAISCRGERKIRYEIAKATAPLSVFGHPGFDLVVCFMGLMSICDVAAVISDCAAALVPNGRMKVALRHPCFGSPDARWQKVTGARPELVITKYFEETPYE